MRVPPQPGEAAAKSPEADPDPNRTTNRKGAGRGGCIGDGNEAGGCRPWRGGGGAFSKRPGRLRGKGCAGPARPRRRAAGGGSALRPGEGGTAAAAAPPGAGARPAPPHPRCRPAGAGGASRAAELPATGRPRHKSACQGGGNYGAVKKSARWMVMKDDYYFCCCFNGKPEVASRSQRATVLGGVVRVSGLWLHPTRTVSSLQTCLTPGRGAPGGCGVPGRG